MARRSAANVVDLCTCGLLKSRIFDSYERWCYYSHEWLMTDTSISHTWVLTQTLTLTLTLIEWLMTGVDITHVGVQLGYYIGNGSVVQWVSA